LIKEAYDLLKTKFRGFLALIVVGSFCYVGIVEKAIDPLGALAIVIVNWYFWSRQNGRD